MDISELKVELERLHAALRSLRLCGKDRMHMFQRRDAENAENAETQRTAEQAQEFSIKGGCSNET